MADTQRASPRIVGVVTAAGTIFLYAIEFALGVWSIFEATSLGKLEGAFDAMTNAGIQGLVLSGSGLFYQGRATIAKLAIARRLPTCGCINVSGL